MSAEKSPRCSGGRTPSARGEAVTYQDDTTAISPAQAVSRPGMGRPEPHKCSSPGYAKYLKGAGNQDKPQDLGESPFRFNADFATAGSLCQQDPADNPGATGVSHDGHEGSRAAGGAASDAPPAPVEPLGIMRISGADASPHAPVTVTSHVHGTICADCGKVRTKPAGSGGKRGTIREWSRQSRTRLRRFLATSDGEKGWYPFGVTMTIPGDILSESDYRKAWNVFRHLMPTMPLIWRVELQKRLQPHIHAVGWHKPSEGQLAALEMAWWDTLRRIPDAVHGDRFHVPGALRHAVRIDEVNQHDPFGWWRYLASHTGKAKQAQLGWRGRNWGVLNPELLTSTAGIQYGLTMSQFYRMRRMMRRLLGWRGANRCGRGARSVWYLSPGQVAMLVEWVKKGA